MSLFNDRCISFVKIYSFRLFSWRFLRILCIRNTLLDFSLLQKTLQYSSLIGLYLSLIHI